MIAGWAGATGGSGRKEKPRSLPQLEVLEGRAVLSAIHNAAAIKPPPPPGPVEVNPPPSSNINPLIFEYGVLANVYAHELSNHRQLGTLFSSVGQRAGEPGYLPFLDFNRSGVITESDVLPLVQGYHIPYRLLRVS